MRPSSILAFRSEGGDGSNPGTNFFTGNGYHEMMERQLPLGLVTSQSLINRLGAPPPRIFWRSIDGTSTAERAERAEPKKTGPYVRLIEDTLQRTNPIAPILRPKPKRIRGLALDLFILCPLSGSFHIRGDRITNHSFSMPLNLSAPIMSWLWSSTLLTLVTLITCNHLSISSSLSHIFFPTETHLWIDTLIHIGTSCQHAYLTHIILHGYSLLYQQLYISIIKL